ncbi:MAG TPA: hypothetical protein VFN22_07525 [Gemmatimonadales bacterium]|nr:hypothetical protein [Gemmatimonadales bacterium]
MRASILLTLALLTATSGCDNAGQDLALPGLVTGAVGVGVILDRDGTGTATPFDTIVTGVRVALFAEGGVDTVQVAVTDTVGLALFRDVPIGRYRFAVVPGSIGDSLPSRTIVGDSVFRISATREGAVAASNVLVGYPTLTLTEARAAQVDRPVFVRGLVTSALQYFPDSATYLTDGAAYLRVIPSAHRPGRSGNNRGDSVIVFGRTARVAGQPVLADGRILTVSERPVPPTVAITVAEARNARGGELDAALVSIDSAVIADTTRDGNVFVAHLARDTDTALVRIDSVLQVPTQAFAPGRSLRVTGMLVPLGDGTWYLRPRPVAGELLLLN